MINQLVIQIIIEDKNLPSKMHGSFLVKLLRFCISSTEEAKMKKKTIYVVIAIAVVAILAIGFQTAPKTPAFDFESNPIAEMMAYSCSLAELTQKSILLITKISTTTL